MAFYESTDQVAILKERLKELSRIRSGFATHLGSSLYEVTKDDEKLRWGRESLYDGIAMCDEERKRVLEAIATLELGQPMEPPAAPEVEETIEFEVPAEETFAATVEFEPPVEETFAATVEFEPPAEETYEEAAEIEYEPAVAPEVEPALEDRPFSFGFDEPEEMVEVAPEPEPEPAASNVCPNCGSEVGPGDRFCMECGASLAQAPQSAPAPKANICPNCGSPTEPGFKFCMVCGQKL